MSIPDKVRKELWGKSGNKCAICRIDLFHEGDINSYNIGEECHIVSERPNGPRHIDEIEDYNTYDNLVLLCRNHHKEIDDPANISKYTCEKLKQIKEKHEKWVGQKLSEKNEKDEMNIGNDGDAMKGGNNGDAMNRVSTGGVTGKHNPMVTNCLGTVVRGLKARVTRWANQNNIPFGWQARFYDRVVRNQNELNNIAEYIENNVINWHWDEMNLP